MHSIQTSKTSPNYNSSMNPSFLPTNLLPAAALAEYYKNSEKNPFSDDVTRQSVSPYDSGASSAEPEDDNSSRSTSGLSIFRPASSPCSESDLRGIRNSKENRKRKTASVPSVKLSSASFVSSSAPHFSTRPIFVTSSMQNLRSVPASCTSSWHNRNGGDLLLHSPAVGGVAIEQEQPIDLSIKSTALLFRSQPQNEEASDSEPELSIDLHDDGKDLMKNPLDLSVVTKRSEEVPLTG